MNSVTRTCGFAHKAQQIHTEKLMSFDWSSVILLISILFTAVAMLYVKDLERRLFISSGQLRQQQLMSEMQHRKLLLQYSNHLSQSKIQTIAMQKGMIVPNDKDVEIIEHGKIWKKTA